MLGRDADPRSDAWTLRGTVRRCACGCARRVIADWWSASSGEMPPVRWWWTVVVPCKAASAPPPRPGAPAPACASPVPARPAVRSVRRSDRRPRVRVRGPGPTFHDPRRRRVDRRGTVTALFSRVVSVNFFNIRITRFFNCVSIIHTTYVGKLKTAQLE